MSEREQFEAWIKAPPIEVSIDRYGSDQAENAWPEQYVSYKVELAWQAWQASRSRLQQTPAPSSPEDTEQGGGRAGEPSSRSLDHFRQTDGICGEIV